MGKFWDEDKKVFRDESAIQFDGIYTGWHNPEKRIEREIKKRREERSNIIKKDAGM